MIDDFVGTGSTPTAQSAAGQAPAPTLQSINHNGLPEIVRQFKTFSARRINIAQGNGGMIGTQVWQRNYWEHIIRNERSYTEIAGYIINNPLTWKQDELYYEVILNVYARRSEDA